MVKTKQETQFKGEMQVARILLTLLALSLTNTRKTKSKKKKLEDNNLKIHDKIDVLEKQSDNCLLLYATPYCKGEVTDDVAIKTICENINDNIITVDDIDRSHRTGKYDPQRKNPRPVIVTFARCDVRDRVFLTNTS